MTTLDELQRSVERLNRAVERLSGGMGKYGFANVYNDDVQLLLSERAELLAANERMREELDVAAVHLQLAGGWLREAGDDGQCANELLRASNRARAALTTGEEK